MRRLAGIFKPPVFEDAEKTHQAYLLNILLWALVVVPFPYVTGTLLTEPALAPRAFGQALFGETVNVVLLVMMRRGLVRQASVLQVVMLWLFFAVTATTGAGATGQAYQMGFPVVILIAGMLLGFRAALATTFMSVAVGVFLVAGPIRPSNVDTPVGMVMISGVIFPMLAVLQYLSGAIIRRALGKAQLSEERYRGLVDESPVGILAVDKNGRILLANPTAAKVLGRNASELAGTRLDELFADTPGLRESTDWNERTFPRKDGTKVELLVTIKQQPHGGRQVLFQDVTERRRAEAERRRLAQQLEQSQRLESIGRLAGGVAHDFNNLLTVIAGNTALALDDLPPGQPAREWLEEVDQASRSAAKLTQQLLGFGRRQPAAPKVIDLNSAVGDVQKLLRRMIGEDVKLEAELSPDTGHVRLDPGQLEQILVNLAVNARDAMPKGGRLTMTTKRASLEADGELPAGTYAVLSVNDTGRGIPPEVMPHVFEPFFTTKGRGNGMGLATVYGIVRQNGGAVTVQSEVGTGTTFRIVLPSVQAADARPAPKPMPVPRRGRERIFLVEDEEPVRELATRVLDQAGYQVHAFASGEEAMAGIENQKLEADLLVTDVVMPGMNGRELAAALTAILPAIKVLFTSGYDDDVIAHHGLVRESVALLPKPYTPRDLAQRVREALGDSAPSVA